MIEPSKLHPELEFQTARSGGSGGQNVNKVESKVELRFDVVNSLVLSEGQKELLFKRLANKINSEGILVLQHQTERGQLANKQKVIKKFDELMAKSLKPIFKRIKPPVPQSVKAARRKGKEHQSEIKKMRGKVDLPQM